MLTRFGLELSHSLFLNSYKEVVVCNLNRQIHRLNVMEKYIWRVQNIFIEKGSFEEIAERTKEKLKRDIDKLILTGFKQIINTDEGKKVLYAD